MFPRRQQQHVLGVGYPTGYGYHPGVGGYVMGYARPRRYGSRRQNLVGQAMMDPGMVAPMPMAPGWPGAMMPTAPGWPGGAAPPDCMPAPPGCGPVMMPTDCGPPGPGYSEPMSFQRPPWRGGMLAPGMPAPGEGHVPLPLASAAGGLFTFAAQAPQTFFARPQKPYKGTRLIVIASHIPAVAGGPTTPSRLQGQVFVGTDPQQGQLGNIDLESLGAPTAFDTWLSVDQAEPGVEIQLQTSLSTPLLIPGESILVNAYFIGHWVS